MQDFDNKRANKWEIWKANKANVKKREKAGKQQQKIDEPVYKRQGRAFKKYNRTVFKKPQ